MVSVLIMAETMQWVSTALPFLAESAQRAMMVVLATAIIKKAIFNNVYRLLHVIHSTVCSTKLPILSLRQMNAHKQITNEISP